MLREIGGQNDRSPKASCQLFEPRRKIHGGADACEIEPITAANIAVEHFADMKRQTKAYSVRIGKRVDGINVDLGFARGGERAEAGLACIRHAFSEGEDRQQPVANELEDLTAVPENRWNLTIEITVKRINQLLWRQPVRHRCKAAHIREPDHRMDRFGMASPNAPGQNALAGIMADIGIEQVASSSLQCPDLSNTRERPYDRLDAGRCASVNPPACRVDQVATWTESLVKISGVAR